ncbi:AraC family transcriptional regulator [Desulforamulus ruminis]|uniref:Helix-turn-helix-domain containing protein AraC type n=1 Tax=Desulforamulus ruminis (strain ATCC 23193 / DSM 2154 / NCIMB 8452 / DL) TaxID=696281 RepID=F6DLR7_DESRL|nr:AraC family transcriptional regulator [Desulforamulus ruminis]AEG58360.1 helix-turn-helix- domain containing protein AraC type [Desulforamulus ruminis DSM 2154]
MLNEIRTIYLDPDLNIEAYHFKGIMQKFPTHFHDHYTIGFIESGQRYLACKDKEFIINPGDLVLFNPGDSHACEQIDGKTLDFRCINVKPEPMKRAVLEITGRDTLPYFTQSVHYGSGLSTCLRELHLSIAQEERDFKKEELFLFLIEELVREYSDLEYANGLKEPRSEIKAVCQYLEANYAQNISLDHLSALTGLSKYYLLRSFTKQKGISPYSYLETIRVNNAKILLEQGVKPIEAAFQTGFSDQGHFNHFFKRLIGLTPKQYQKIFCEDRDK